MACSSRCSRARRNEVPLTCAMHASIPGVLRHPPATPRSLSRPPRAAPFVLASRLAAAASSPPPSEPGEQPTPHSCALHRQSSCGRGCDTSWSVAHGVATRSRPCGCRPPKALPARPRRGSDSQLTRVQLCPCCAVPFRKVVGGSHHGALHEKAPRSRLLRSRSVVGRVGARDRRCRPPAAADTRTLRLLPCHCPGSVAGTSCSCCGVARRGACVLGARDLRVLGRCCSCLFQASAAQAPCTSGPRAPPLVFSRLRGTQRDWIPPLSRVSDTSSLSQQLRCSLPKRRTSCAADPRPPLWALVTAPCTATVVGLTRVYATHSAHSPPTRLAP
jgi:hypothetical protein